ncbi:DNA-binding transcriptional activator of the SARP family [Saccharomonospora marina XMU15]|uniref:DNA-binding transcriptional activator of the SARP family n=1 Tax=Saccharomonospora marina XMU15 TaxID=882083 RepID=H5X9S9_9PSEU|nr:BTAD domain-containing putative transcriptional regulator [Saccharomonospora marina]EHR52567.1 DNA-binding transcriptional activator of the SARP family [Saccharomonospora marina XMU15]
MTRFGVLGPLTATSATGEQVRLRGQRQRALLAMLLCHEGELVPVDRLVEALWPDVPPKSYASNLHTYLSRLRERLGGINILHESRGYRLLAHPGDLDLRMFRLKTTEGRRAVREGDPAAAVACLRHALAQWRGPAALADVHVPQLAAFTAALDAERLTVLEDCFDAELDLGRHTEVVGELEGFLAEHPLRERAAAQLMLALRRGGRQADALAVYTRTRSRLVEELGVEPGAELRRAQAAVLSGEDDVRRARSVATATAGSAGAAGAAGSVAPWPICQLPPDLSDFFGRRTELDTITELLAAGEQTVPVTVVSGEPGSGKSALAARAAHRVRTLFPDGQLFVHLAGASAPRDPADVLADLLRALGVAGPAIPDDPQARAAAYRGRLTDRRVLVVLDDAASPEQVRPLLPGTPGCAVLVTSRFRFSGLDGAYRVPLGPFTDAESTALLERIVGRQRVTAEPVAAARIAAACGNLPLALRIAGTRLAMRPNLRLRALADRLDDERNRLDELAVNDRQVRTSIALSYHALSPAARDAIRALALCGDISAPAWAIAVLIGRPVADGVIEELVEASLLAPISTDSTGEPRYRLHDLVRVFAREQQEQLHSSEEQVRTVRGIVDATLGLTDAAARQLPWTVPLPMRSPAGLPPQPLSRETVARLVDDAQAWFATEQANLVTVIDSIFRIGWHHKAVMILERLGAYLWLRGQYADMRDCHERLRLRARRVGERRIEAWAEANIAVLVHARGEHDEAERRYRRCAALLSELGERGTAAWVTGNLAGCLIGLGRPQEALDIADRALKLLGTDQMGVQHVELVKAEAFNRLGRLEESVRACRRTLAAARLSGDPLRIALALHGLSWSLALCGELETAHELAEESVSLLRPLPVRSALARSLRTLGAIRAGLRRRQGAMAAYTEAHLLASELDERPRQLSCGRAIAAWMIGEGKVAEAIAALRDCLTEFRQMGSVASVAITLRVLVRAYEVVGEDGLAERAAAEADRLANPSDASAVTLVALLLELTRDAGRALVGTRPAPPPVSDWL